MVRDSLAALAVSSSLALAGHGQVVLALNGYTSDGTLGSASNDVAFFGLPPDATITNIEWCSVHFQVGQGTTSEARIRLSDSAGASVFEIDPSLGIPSTSDQTSCGDEELGPGTLSVGPDGTLSITFYEIVDTPGTDLIYGAGSIIIRYEFNQDDCNGNGTPDATDLSSGASLDCNDDDVPDECQLGDEPLTYRFDDDDPSNGVRTGISMAWMTQFTVEHNARMIRGIELRFAGPFRPGTPVTAILWSDPNNDRSPDDAVVLASTQGFSNSLNAAQASPINTFLFPQPVDVGPDGTSFFVGLLHAQGPSEFPAALDPSNWIAGRCWVAGDDFVPVDPHNLAAAQTLAPVEDEPIPFGAWIMRALATTPDTDLNANGIPDECDPPCLADWDGSGGQPNSSDFLAYLNDWVASEPRSDLAPPGGVWDSSDFLAFLNAFSDGC